MPSKKAKTSGVEGGVGVVRETPAQTSTNNGNNFLSALVGLFCTRMCKAAPITDSVPNAEYASVFAASPHAELKQGFSKDVCRSMVAMLDADRSGKLGYEEFKSLWSSVRDWKIAFRMHDVDHSGSLSGFELRNTLNSAGYRLNNHILNILMHRYGNLKRELEFDDFIMCAVKLKAMIEHFKNKDASNSKIASFSFEDWIETTLYS